MHVALTSLDDQGRTRWRVMWIDHHRPWLPDRLVQRWSGLGVGLLAGEVGICPRERVEWQP